MANLDPYDDWKEQGRPGGSFNAWKASQGGGTPTPAPAATPTPQAPAPQAPKPAGAPDMSGFQGAGGFERWSAANKAAGGTGDRASFDQQMNWGSIPPLPSATQPMRTAQTPAATPGGAPAGLMDFNTWMAQGNANRGNTPAWTDDAETRGAYEAYKYGAANPGQGGGMTAGGYSSTGDPTGMRAAAKAQGMSEDYDRFSNAQLASWESQKDAACPPNKPYRSYADNTCQEKPIDSERGAGGGGGGGGGGAAGQGGSGGGAGAAAGAPAGGKGMDEMLTYWKKLISGEANPADSRYNDKAMAALEADQFSRARAQEKNQLAMARQDMAQRGVARSANQNAATRQIGVGTGQQIMANRAQIQKAKIDADYQDRQAAINNAQNWVNSMRDYLLRGDANAIQREQIAAQMRLAQMNIDAQKAQLQQNYRNQLGLMEQSYANNLSTGMLLG